MRKLDDKVAVITGAGSGIGRALALNLAHRGTALALSDVKSEAVDETASMCKDVGVQAIPYVLDVANRDAVYAHAEAVHSDFGKVNLIVNNAGVALTASIEDMTWEDFEWVVNIDFWGVTYGTKAFLPHLITSGEGHIVNLSSVFGLVGVPTQSAYNAAKFAVRGFTEALRQEMKIAGHPVGVSCVHPGGVRTNISRDARGISAADHDKVNTACERYSRTTPDEAAAAIIRGVQRNSAKILIGADTYAYDLAPRVLGGQYQDLSALGARVSSPLLAKLGITL